MADPVRTIEQFNDLDLASIKKELQDIKLQLQSPVQSPQIGNTVTNSATGATMAALAANVALLFSGAPDARLVSISVVYNPDTTTYEALVIHS